MKILYNATAKARISISCVLLFLCAYASAQVTPIDTIKPGKGDPNQQLKQIKEVKVKTLADSANGEPKKNPVIDTTVFNKYGDLLNDDIRYNKKYPFWK